MDTKPNREPVGRREQRREARREELLATALKIAAREGIEALTLARLAEACDGSVGAIYRYFPSKAALLVGLQQMAIEELAAEVVASAQASRNAFAHSGSSDLAQASLGHLFAALRPVLRQSIDHPDRHRLIDALVSSQRRVLSDQELAEVNRTLDPLLDTVATLFREAELTGALTVGDPAQRTRLVWAALHGLDHFRKRDGNVDPQHRVDVLVGAMLRALLLGFGAAPARLEAALKPALE